MAIGRSWAIRLAVLGCLFFSAVACWAEPIQLRFVVWEGNDGLVVIRKCLDEFEKAHPGVQVKLENVEFNTYFQKLLAQYAANVAPDVAMLDPGHFQAYAKRGALNSLEPYFPDTPDFKLGDYYPTAIDSYRMDGKLYVLPRDVAPVGIIFYNKKLFDEAHVPYPDGSWTWDFKERPELKEKDFIWVMHQLTKKDDKGKTVQFGYVPAWPTAMADLFMYSQGAQYADSIQHPTKTLYSDPRIVNAYQWAADLMLKYNYVPSTSQLNSQFQTNGALLFSSGKVAMYESGIWDAQGIRMHNTLGSKDFFDWDITLAPAFKDGHRGAPTGGSGYGMLSSTPHPKESWELIQWLAGDHGMVEMARAGIAQPAISRLAESDCWIPNAQTPPDQRYPASRHFTNEAMQWAATSPTADYWNEINDIANPQFDPVFNGSASAKQQLDYAQTITNERLKAILKKGDEPPFNWVGGILVGLGVIVGLIAWVAVPELRKRRTDAEKVEGRTGYVFLTPLLVGIALFTVGPMIVSLLMSFSDWDIITPARWVGFGNYYEAFFADKRFWNTVLVTALFTVLAVPSGLVMSLGLALLLNQKVRGIPVYRTFFYLPALASAVASALIWQKVFQQEGGIANTVIYGPHGDWNILGIGGFLSSLAGKPGPPDWLGSEHLVMPAMAIMALWASGGSMIILLAALQGVPQQYYEAATLDGANAWQRLKVVTIPMIAPALFFVMVTSTIGSLQTFTQSFVLTQGGPHDASRFYMYHLYDAAFRNLRMGYASSLAWILFVVILLLTLIQFMAGKRIYYEAEAR